MKKQSIDFNKDISENQYLQLASNQNYDLDIKANHHKSSYMFEEYMKFKQKLLLMMIDHDSLSILESNIFEEYQNFLQKSRKEGKQENNIKNHQKKSSQKQKQFLVIQNTSQSILEHECFISSSSSISKKQKYYNNYQSDNELHFLLKEKMLVKKVQELKAQLESIKQESQRKQNIISQLIEKQNHQNLLNMKELSQKDENKQRKVNYKEKVEFERIKRNAYLKLERAEMNIRELRCSSKISAQNNDELLIDSEEETKDYF